MDPKSRHAAPHSNLDFDFFYDGLEDGKLLIQRCDQCHRLRNPPLPMCPNCNSLKWTPEEMARTGTLFSYTVHHHPPLPGFTIPHAMGIVALDDGNRFFAAFDEIPLHKIKIGLRLKAEFFRRNDVAVVRFGEESPSTTSSAESAKQ